MNILITGGAGYIGTSLIPLLLQDGHRVTVLDNLLHGAEAMLPFFRSERFSFIKGDTRNLKAMREAINGNEAIVHLAAIVGMHACNINQQDTISTNVEGSRNILTLVDDQRVIYTSTVSTYGKFEGGVCNEEAPLRPLSLYGETKAEAEKLLLEHPGTTALRLSTLFGLSPRMRLDLLVNDFTYQSVFNKSMVVYQSEVIRAMVHILDAVDSIRMALVRPDMQGKIYNVVGCNPLKREICEVIQKETGAYFHYAEVGEDGDGRNAAVNGNKLASAGWKPRRTLVSGVHEMARAFSAFKIRNPYANT